MTRGRVPSTAGRRWPRRSRPAVRSCRPGRPRLRRHGRSRRRRPCSHRPSRRRRGGPHRPARVTDEEHTEHTPRWSPSGRQLAFVAARPHIDEIHVVAPDGTACTTISPGDGWRVEDLHWIDEDCLAPIVAPRNTDTAVGLGSLRGAAGSGPMRGTTTAGVDGWSPSTCRPVTSSGSTPCSRRCGRCARSTVAGSRRSSRTNRPSPAGTAPGCRCWTAPGRARASPSAWQIAAPRVSPDGTRIALVEGWASDRGYVAGDVVVIDLVGHSSTTWSIDGVDVIGLDWLDDEQLRFHGWHNARSAHGVVAADGTVASIDRRRRRAARADGLPRPRRADGGWGDGTCRRYGEDRRRDRRGWMASCGRSRVRPRPRPARRRALVDRDGRHRGLRAAAHTCRCRSAPVPTRGGDPRRAGQPVDARRVGRSSRPRLVGLRRDPAQPARQRRAAGRPSPGPTSAIPPAVSSTTCSPR